MSTGTKVLRAVAGTVVGFVLGALLIEVMGVDPIVLWTVLPIVAFIAAYVPEVASFAAGQAGFTMMVLIVFNLIAPSGWRVGLIRIEDIVVGGAVGLVVSLLLWPRGSGNGGDRGDRRRFRRRYPLPARRGIAGHPRRLVRCRRGGHRTQP